MVLQAALEKAEANNREFHKQEEERHLRLKCIHNNVCPDCGADLVKTHGFWSTWATHCPIHGKMDSGSSIPALP